MTEDINSEQVRDANDANVHIKENTGSAEQVNTADTSIEEKARSMGWKPKEEFRGDPDRWTDAETFAKVGEQRIPVMKENFERLSNDFKNLKEELRLTKEYHKDSEKRQYDRAMRDLQQQQRQAVEEADTEQFDRIEKKKEQVREDYFPKQSEKVAKTNSQEIPPEVQQWQLNNPWYQNPTLAIKAQQAEQKIMEEEAFKSIDDPFFQPMSTSDRLQEVTRRVKAEYGKSKTDQNPRKLPAVEGTRQASTKASKTWSDIPQEDRAKAHQWISAGIISQSDYIKDYFGE